MLPTIDLRGIIIGLLIDGINFVLQQIIAPAQTLFTFVTSMPLRFTTANDIVIAGWTTMAAVADGFLGLFVLIGTIQIMYGDVTGGLRMPLVQFLGKAILTGILIHLSAIIGQDLLVINNQLSGVVAASGGASLQILGMATAPGGNVFSTILAIAVTVSFLRLVFQGIKRIVRFNLLFVLSGPAFLLSMHPATEPVFGTWIRMLCATAFEQFVQFLALSLALQFVRSTGQTNIAGLFVTLAVLGLVAEVPSLLSQLVGSSTLRGGVSGLLKAAVLLKFLI